MIIIPLNASQEKDTEKNLQKRINRGELVLSFSNFKFILPCTWRNFLVRCIRGTGCGPAFCPLLNAPLHLIRSLQHQYDSINVMYWRAPLLTSNRNRKMVNFVKILTRNNISAIYNLI